MCISIVIIEALFDELPYLRRRSDSFGVLMNSHGVPPCQERLSTCRHEVERNSWQ